VRRLTGRPGSVRYAAPRITVDLFTPSSLAMAEMVLVGSSHNSARRRSRAQPTIEPQEMARPLRPRTFRMLFSAWQIASLPWQTSGAHPRQIEDKRVSDFDQQTADSTAAWELGFAALAARKSPHGPGDPGARASDGSDCFVASASWSPGATAVSAQANSGLQLLRQKRIGSSYGIPRCCCCTMLHQD
jgi:hypothetical protein